MAKKSATKKPTPAPVEEKKNVTVEPETGGETGDTLTLEDLRAAAQDLNECLYLDPPMEVDELDEDELRSALESASKLITTEDLQRATFPKGTPIDKRVDKTGAGPYLAAETLEVLEAMNVELPWPKKKGGKKDKAAKPKKAKAEKQPRYTRKTALADAILAGCKTKEELLDKSDTLFVENGGSSNPKEAAWCANVVLPVLEMLDVPIYRK
jgi:hypothetical protein